MVRGKCTLGRGLGPSPQESVSVPLSEHIYSSVSTSRQELSLSHYFKLYLGKLFWGKFECLGEKLPPPSILNPGCIMQYMYMCITTTLGSGYIRVYCRQFLSEAHMYIAEQCSFGQCKL